MNQLELLSPAGDLEIFKAVINAGADAVYFGGDLFGARAYAKNFTIDEGKEAISYAHVHGAKAYLTVNTLLKNLEIEKDLYKYLKAYVENGIDAFIVQDFGVFQLIKDFFPDTDIHASTQMSLASEFGANFIEQCGASRIVTAREISLEEIGAIHKRCPDLEIESFVHGALCVCYSGQCLMSSIIGGRSGNRGRCAQPCRLPYNMYLENSKHVKTRGNYLLSPKDFCTIEHLPQMVEAGVMSFKIEGRMKQLAYATGVVSIYRKYLDRYLYKGGRDYSVSDEDIQKLLDYGNRSGFTDLYMTKHNGPEMITFEEPSHSKSSTEAVSFPEKKIKVNCKVVARLGQEFTLKFSDEVGNCAEAKGNVIEASMNKPATKEDIVKAVSGLGNTSFVIDKLNVEFDDGIFLPVSVIKNARRQAIEQLSEKLFDRSVKQIIEFQELEKKQNTENTDLHKVFVTVNTLEQAIEVANYDFVDTIAAPIEIVATIKDNVPGKKLGAILPTVIRRDYVNSIVIPDCVDRVLASSYDGIGYLNDIGYDKEKIIIDHRLYSFSNRAVEAFDELGYSSNVIPVELSLKEISHRDNSNSQFIIYGRLPLMITANCNIKNTSGCNKANQLYYLQDRKGEILPVKCNCNYCYNTIYNGKKYIAFSLADEISKLGVKEYRIDFTLESEKEIRDTLEAYEATFINHQAFSTKEDYTKGHLKRGVE